MLGYTEIACLLVVTLLAACGGGDNGASSRSQTALAEGKATLMALASAAPVPEAGVIAFTPNRYDANEGAMIQLTVSRQAGFTGAVSVTYATAEGTALEGTDYLAASGTLNWPDGDSSPRTITVSVAQDASVNGERWFSVQLSSPTGGAVLSADAEAARVFVTDDEAGAAFPTGCQLPQGWVVPLITHSFPEQGGDTTGWSAVTDTQTGAGPCSLRTNSIENLTPTYAGSRSYVYYTAAVQTTVSLADGNIKFLGRMAAFDCTVSASRLSLSVDGVAVYEHRGNGIGCAGGGGTPSTESTTGVISVPVSAGIHTLRWTYTHWNYYGGSREPSLGTSYAWIDSVSLPLPGARAPSVPLVRQGRSAGSLDVTFGAPPIIGTSPITGYTATCLAPGEQSRSASGANSPLTVAGLSPLSAYRCAVAANYTNGIAAYSGTAEPALPRRALDLSSDFDQDGKPDILFQNSVTGERLIWLMEGLQFKAFAALANVAPNWQIVGTGDFNGDGKPDILWHNRLNGDVVVWFMNGTTPTGLANVGNGQIDWTVAGTGDFNGDGQVDILWRDSTGRLQVWLMNGAKPAGIAYIPNTSIPDTRWKLVIGDFNADGKPDLLWQSPQGYLRIWLMDGLRQTGELQFGVVPTGWSIVSSGDFNGDGFADILWENTGTGERTVWLMNGPTPLQSIGVGWATTDWTIAK